MQKSLIKISLSEVKIYEKNNKRHGANVDEIVKSIQANTYITPIIIDEDNIILAGHGRKLALDKLQVTEAEVLQVTGLSETQKRDFRIRDNKLTELSEWDRDNLKFELDDLNIPDLTDLFKDEEEMEEESQEAEEDDFEVDDQVKTDIVLGDLFEIGEHRLLCGDSTNIDDVNKLMNGCKADMVLTDPPYNVAYEGKTKDSLTIQNDKMNNNDFLEFLKSVFNCYLISMNDGCPIYVFCPLEDGAFLNSYLNSGLKLQSILIWLKNTIVMGRKDHHYKHEPILYGWKEGTGHKWYGGFDKSTVIECNKPPRNGQLPTMKPIELLGTILERSSEKNNILLDLFLGSGSTMVACHQLNRKCYGMELDPKYCQVIVDRMINLDPTLTFKKNGQPYNPETNDYLLDK